MASRTIGRLVAAAALLSAGVLGFAAPAGAAAGADSVTIDNATSLTIHSGQTLNLDALARATCKVGLNKRLVSLSIVGPTGPSQASQPVKSNHVPCNQDATLTTSISSPQRNGSYAVILENSSPQNATAATLDVLIPPARAKSFSIATAGTVASFGWAANSEPDVVAYQVLNSSGGVAVAETAASACAGSSMCTGSLDLGPGAAGKTEKFSVRAVRCGLTCTGTPLLGAASLPAAASFAKATPTPTPTPSTTETASPTPSPTHSNGGGGGKGGGNGTTSSHSGGGSRAGATNGHGGGSAAARHHGGRAHLPSATGQHRRSLHPPKLPGLLSLNKPLIVDKSGGNVPAPQVASSQPARTTTQAITHDITTGLQLPPLWRGIAAAAVLLLIAMHLRTWVARVDLS